ADGATCVAIHKELQDVNDLADTFGWNESLEKKRADLLDRLKTAKRTLNPTLKRQHHNVATQLRTFVREKLVKDMPQLAAHLQASLKLDFPEFGYYPPDPAPDWQF